MVDSAVRAESMILAHGAVPMAARVRVRCRQNRHNQLFSGIVAAYCQRGCKWGSHMVKRRRAKSKLHLRPRDRLLLLIFGVILLMSVALATYLGLQMAGQSKKSSSHGSEKHASQNFRHP